MSPPDHALYVATMRQQRDLIPLRKLRATVRVSANGAPIREPSVCTFEINALISGPSSVRMTPRREHSRKPDELYHRIERYVGGEGPFLECLRGNPDLVGRPGSWKRLNSIRPARQR